MVLVLLDLTGSWRQAHHRTRMLEVKCKSFVVVALWRKLVEVLLDELDLLEHVAVLEIA